MNLKKIFFSRPQQYTDVTPLTPAEKAKRKWDEREGAIIAQNYNLRLLNIGQLLVNISVCGMMAWMASQSSVQPFVVFANPESGEIWHVGTAAEAKDFTPTEEIKKYFISSFIKNIREIPLDEVVYKQNLVKGFSFLTTGTADKLQALLRDEDLTGKVTRQETSQVRIVSILPMENGNRYQVRWQEDEYHFLTKRKLTKSYTGIFATQIIKGTDAKSLELNPIGFYITDFNWTQDATKDNNGKK